MDYQPDETAVALLMAGHSAVYRTAPDAREALASLAAEAVREGDAAELLEDMAILAGAMPSIAARTSDGVDWSMLVRSARVLLQTYRDVADTPDDGDT